MLYLIILLILLVPSFLGFFFRILNEKKSDSLITLIIGVSIFILVAFSNSQQIDLKEKLATAFDSTFLGSLIYLVFAWCNIGIVTVLSLPGIKLANKLIKNKN